MKLVVSLKIIFVLGIMGGSMAACSSGPAPSSSQLSQTTDATQTQSIEEFGDAYRLGGGDRLRVNVFGEDDLSGEFVIDGGGHVSLPLVGEVQAGGMTVREFEQETVSVLSERYLRNPQVSVEVLNFRPFYILGEVNAGGEYPYVQRMTVLNAVAVAGGFTYRADRNRVFVVRADSPDEIELDLDQGAIVLPGDIIRIPERFF